jgi:hypothetical protein
MPRHHGSIFPFLMKRSIRTLVSSFFDSIEVKMFRWLIQYVGGKGFAVLFFSSWWGFIMFIEYISSGFQDNGYALR